MQYTIKRFDPMSTSEALWRSFLALEEEKHYEEHPDDPVPSKEEKKRSLQFPSPRFTVKYWIATLKGKEEIIGSAYLSVYENHHPNYESNAHIAFSYLTTRKGYRRKGVAKALLKEIVIWLKHNHRSVLQGGSQIESGKAFCSALGGKKAIVEEESRLKFKNIDWNMLSEWKSTGQVQAPDVTLERFERIPEEDIEEFCELFSETLNLVPKEELEWEAKETPAVRRATEDRFAKLKTIRTTIISREKTGSLSGLTETFLFKDRPTILFQGLTGVSEKFQGRGLGKMLKAEMLFYCKDRFPDVEVVATESATVNKPMLGINKRLGFKHYRTWVDYKFNIEELVETLSR